MLERCFGGDTLHKLHRPGWELGTKLPLRQITMLRSAELRKGKRRVPRACQGGGNLFLPATERIFASSKGLLPQGEVSAGCRLGAVLSLALTVLFCSQETSTVLLSRCRRYSFSGFHTHGRFQAVFSTKQSCAAPQKQTL